MTKNIFYIKQSALDQLLATIPETVEFYHQDMQWLDNYFSSNEWKNESVVGLETSLSLLLPLNDGLHDLENTKILFSGLKGISIAQATDERLWTYLSLHRFWEYMRKRWPVEKRSAKEKVSYIRERYFFMQNPDRALVRHGISRLWWYGYYSYDESYDDPFALTNVLLKKLDVTQSIFERAFSRNKDITKCILEVLYEFEKVGRPFYDRKKFRTLMKYVNQIGGVTILDLLSKEELKQILMGKIEEIQSSSHINVAEGRDEVL